MNAIEKKFAKRVYMHIQNIQVATDMFQVIEIIETAKLDAFKLRNLGLEKYAHRKAGTLPAYEKAKAYRIEDKAKHENDFSAFIKAFVPQRLSTTIMYSQTFN